ncbi:MULTISPECIES: TrlF family AAA-like ATPase [Acinetobacter]|uniref:TrlF family AAA-like ATPase n=1 Tax=Acinetobacter TaxID=469 RepID=UPI001A165575|nr:MULTISPECIES: AAA family ATPase [Acinetobacter]MCU4388159.1 AAA family ATPase [Acinetobacter haemolyticus]HIQ35564.1 histidinol phosphatase [Acinetobacter venetianus]HJP46368.1 histidinol phosphatase [Acinetobacter venetianus]
MTNNIGSQWYKFDFHTHTPASLDYRDNPAPSCLDWLKAVMSAKIDCVAITDHNTGSGIDSLKDAYLNCQNESWFRPLTIFPGCEITISQGQGRIHFLAIFDPSTSSENITHFLGSCDIQGKSGDPENSFTQLSIASVIDKIKNANGLALPAHIEGPKGLFEGVTTTNPDIKAILKHINAAQFIDIDYLDGEKIDIGLKEDCKHLARLKGSDAHKVENLGSSYSWVKLSEKSIKGLKYALMDHHFCVLNQINDPNTTPPSYIRSLTIKEMNHCGKFTNNLPIFNLHPLFNAIIGGRGTGKSTFIEALRLALGRKNDINNLKNINDDISSFIEGVTNDKTEITLEVKNHASEYSSTWTKNKEISLSSKLNDVWHPDQGSIIERFPVNIYSQKQINALSTQPNSLMEIIDRSPEVGKNYLENKIRLAQEELMSLINEEFKIQNYIKNEGIINSELQALKNNIISYQTQGHKNLLEKKDLMYKVDNYLRTVNLDPFKEKLDYLNNFLLPPINPIPYNELPFDLKDELEQINIDFISNFTLIKSQIFNIKTQLEEAINQRNNAIFSSKWNFEFNDTINKYQEMVRDYQAKGIPFNSQDYDNWITRQTYLENELVSISKSKLRLAEITQFKQKEYNSIINSRLELNKNRQLFVDSVLNGNKYVKINVKPFCDTSSIESTFRQIIGTENFQASIYKEDNPAGSLLNNFINCEATAQNKIAAKDELCQIVSSLIVGSVPPGYSIDQRLLTHLSNKYKQQPEFFSRLVTWFPDDQLEIKYSKSGNGQSFSNIAKGSAGQKAAAILAFLLSHGNEPIIIDQPEDDLDNALISDLIVNQIHKNKNNRQIIIVTHNPNIVVNGDADLVNVMHYQGGQVQIKSSGSLVYQSIRDDVCEIMEGGRDAFHKRFQRIGSIDLI